MVREFAYHILLYWGGVHVLMDLVVHLQSEDWRISANGRGVVKLLGWPKFVTKYAAGVT